MILVSIVVVAITTGPGKCSSINFDCVGKAFAPGATGTNAVHQSGNNYFTPNCTTFPFSACGNDFKGLQALGYEVGSTMSSELSVNQIMDMARTALSM
jgi:hypothetical protein